MSISILFRVNVELLCLVSCIWRFVYGKATTIQRQSLVDMPKLDFIVVMYKYVKIFYSFKLNIDFFLCPWHWPYKKVLFEQPLDYESKSDHVDKYPCWCDTKTLITKHVRQTTFLVQQNKVIVQMSLWTNIHVDVMALIDLKRTKRVIEWTNNETTQACPFNIQLFSTSQVVFTKWEHMGSFFVF